MHALDVARSVEEGGHDLAGVRVDGHDGRRLRALSLGDLLARADANVKELRFASGTRLAIADDYEQLAAALRAALTRAQRSENDCEILQRLYDSVNAVEARLYGILERPPVADGKTYLLVDWLHERAHKAEAALVTKTEAIRAFLEKWDEYEFRGPRLDKELDALREAVKS